MGIFDRVGRWLLGERRSHPRDPALAEWFGGANSSAGVRVTPQTAMSCPAFAACVRLLGDTIATVPLDLYRRLDDGSRERVTDHPLYRLMQAPNDWQTGVDWRRWAVKQMLTYGNTYSLQDVRRNGEIRALTPLESSRTEPFLSEKQRLWYRYWPKSGGAQTLAGAEVLHIRGPFSSDEGLKAESPVELFRDTIGIALAQAEYMSKFFSNAAVPKGAIEIPTSLGDKAAEVLRQSFERRHQGVENAHRVAIFDGGMKFKELGMNHTDAQLVQQYQESVGSVARIFGIPPHMIGDTDKQSSWGTGIEQQAIGFIMFVVRPYYVAFEQALNRSLLSEEARSQYFFEFNADGLLRGDFKSRMDGFALMIQWGMATPNEIRRLMNWPPLAGGDERLQPLNMAPASLVAEVLLKDPAKAVNALRQLQGLPKLEIEHERTH